MSSAGSGSVCFHWMVTGWTEKVKDDNDPGGELGEEKWWVTEEERWDKNMWEEAEPENKANGQQCRNTMEYMNDQWRWRGMRGGTETVTRLRVAKTKVSKCDRFWGEYYQQHTTADIHSHSPVAGIFIITWRCVVGSWSGQYSKMDLHVNCSALPRFSTLRLAMECISWVLRSMLTCWGVSKPLWLISGAHLPQFQCLRINILQGTQFSLFFYIFLQLANDPITPHSN